MDGEREHRGLEETARFFRVSVPTVRRWIEDGCPVVEKGGNGVAYKLDLRQVAAWKRARDEERDASSARQADRDRELQLELLGPDMLAESGGDDAPLRLTPAQQKQALEAELARVRLARERQQLVVADEIRMNTRAAVHTLAEQILALPDRAGRELGLDDGQVGRLQSFIEAALEDLAAEIETLQQHGRGDDAARAA